MVLLAVVAPTRDCSVEYNVRPLWAPSILEQLGCEPEMDAAAADEDRPVAVCGLTHNAVAPIYGQTDLLGAESWDPSGHEIVDWHWSLAERPTGSAARIPAGGADREGFVPDLAGWYVAELVVTNDQCVSSSPCQVALGAVPAQDLWVEMFWEHAGDDMDLHLVAGTGSLESDHDCYYGNCLGGGPNWGDREAWWDDPSLDLDDIDGTGPENINIADPAAGRYRVAVHDYPGSTLHQANDVTVRIHLAGELAFEGTRTLTGEDGVAWFAEISWPSLVVTPL